MTDSNIDGYGLFWCWDNMPLIKLLMKQCQSVVAGKQELNQSWSRELFKFVFSILLKNLSFEKNEDIEK